MIIPFEKSPHTVLGERFFLQRGQETQPVSYTHLDVYKRQTIIHNNILAVQNMYISSSDNEEAREYCVDGESFTEDF